MKPIIYAATLRVFVCQFITALLLFNSADLVRSQDAVRSWSNTAGKTITAEFIRLDGDTLVIRKGDKQFNVLLRKLSAESQEQARALAKSKQPRRTALSQDELSSLWDKLSLKLSMATQTRLDATRALLKLAEEPKSVTDFLAGKVRPVKMTRNELLALISSLGSNEEAEWKRAYERLLICDPRLFMDADQLFQLPQLQKYPARKRFAELVQGSPLDFADSSRAMGTIASKIGLGSRNGIPGLTFTVYGEKVFRAFLPAGSCPAVAPTVYRQYKSLILLASFNTTSADKLILSVAAGHPKAMLTKVARALINDRKTPREKKNLSELWIDLLGEGEFELLDLPKIAATDLSRAHAILSLMKDPLATTKFLSEKLQPAEMTGDELESLLDELASVDKTLSREAYNKLLKFNPSWEFEEIEDLLAREQFQDYPARHRLVDLITCTPWNSYKAARTARYKFVTISESAGENGTEFSVKCGPNDKFRGVSARHWADESERTAESLLLLESFRTNRANELIKLMASGHPKAGISKFARSILENGKRD